MPVKTLFVVAPLSFIFYRLFSEKQREAHNSLVLTKKVRHLENQLSVRDSIVEKLTSQSLEFEEQNLSHECKVSELKVQIESLISQNASLEELRKENDELKLDIQQGLRRALELDRELREVLIRDAEEKKNYKDKYDMDLAKIVAEKDLEISSSNEKVTAAETRAKELQAEALANSYKIFKLSMDLEAEANDRKEVVKAQIEQTKSFYEVEITALKEKIGEFWI